MKKLIKKSAYFTVAAGYLAAASSVLAAGGNQYVPHVPVDTGLGSNTVFAVAAIVSYAIGLAFIASSTVLKNKIASELDA